MTSEMRYPVAVAVPVTAKGYAAWTAESVTIPDRGETHLTAKLRPAE